MADVATQLERGGRNRAVGAHDMNEHSSRSHMILNVRGEVDSTACRRLEREAGGYNGKGRSIDRQVFIVSVLSPSTVLHCACTVEVEL